jgi:drug/metabolite transporter (DMT)-like permease
VESRGVTTSTYSIWIAAAFGMTALWALVVVVNKKVLESVSPVAVNFFIRLATVAGLLLITVPLTALDLWSNGFGINAEAAGWIALAAVAVWLIAFNAYYYALRGERIAVVVPICSTDPIWTALFAWLLLGAAFGGATLVGMAVAMAGVVLISRWMGEGAAAETGALAGAGALAVAAHGDVVPGGTGGAATAAEAGAGGPVAASAPVKLIALAVLAAAGWGLGPVFIDLAASAYGRTTATMMLLSQVLGAIMLGGVLLLRRTPLTPRPLSPPERRRAVLLIGASGMLEAVVSVLFYLSIEEIGPVLTMLIMATTPVFSIVLGVVFLRERPGLRLTLAAAVTVVGVLIATLDGMT